MTGEEIVNILDKKRINVEKYTEKCIVIMTHINITDEDVDQLITAIKEIAA